MEKLQFLTNAQGERTGVFMPYKAFQKIQDDLEELADLRLYDKAKKQCNGKGKDAKAVFDKLLNHP